jgi:arginine transport system substrate-binding protein
MFKRILMMGIAAFVSLNAYAAPIKKITFATEATYPPFEFVTPSGELQGFDIDIAKAICAKIKAECVFINQPFDSLIPSLKLGKFDAIIAAMAITAERQKQVDFTVSYYEDTVSFIGHKEALFDVTPGKLKNKTIGVQQGTTFQTYLEKVYGKDIKVKTYASKESAFLDLKAGRVDAVMGDTPLCLQWLKEHGGGDYKLMGTSTPDPKYFGTGNGIAVKKGNKILLKELNKAITSIKKDGTAKKLEKRYFTK